jgi:hypothetical protein
LRPTRTNAASTNSGDRPERTKKAAFIPANNSIDLLEQPGHVLAEGFRRAQALLILLNFAFGPADADVPVAGARDDHLADQEEMVDRVETDTPVASSE